MADNDTRGWILASASGIGTQDSSASRPMLLTPTACIFGACIICIDYIVRLFPGKEKFEIRRSDTFLSSSLSLSFGVMLFSALYSMLPESKNSLMDGGMSKSAASYTLIGCFLGGVIGIQVISRAFHHFIPSHVVDCEHRHDESDDVDMGHSHHNHDREHGHEHGLGISHDHADALMDGSVMNQFKRHGGRPNDGLQKMASETDALLGGSKRPTPALKSRVSSFLTGAKSTCDEQGPCHGYTDPCGKECFMAKVQTSSAENSPLIPTSAKVVRAPVRSVTQPMSTVPESYNTVDCGQRGTEAIDNALPDGSPSGSTAASPRPGSPDIEQGLGESHHHHVPDNAFLSIGVQTSVAIALHKLPEGFITYATNHANPQLGFSVFVALFIHNITEGFALALPLFLAINSRWKAILAASILGGASQPLGAGIAELWFQAANQRGMKPDEKVYGCMFAITSGIMTSVALQLFSESLGLTHNKTLCIVWAFVGMGVLGLSSALTA